MKTDLTDKAVLVTGASRGIGRATALAYAAEGARVAITYHCDEAGAKETADQVAAAGGTPYVVRYDLGDEDSIRAAVDAVGAEWGGIDVLVAGAVEWGDAIPRPGRQMPAFEDVPPSSGSGSCEPPWMPSSTPSKPCCPSCAAATGPASC